ncbi:MAG: tetratricopeptide repeat protein [Candidatus Binatia bacterium]
MVGTIARYAPLLFAVDVLLVVAHLAWGGDHFWNLDKEHNLPTWFAGVQLVLVALAALDCFEVEKRSKPVSFPPAGAWALLSLSFFYLSLDETTVLHEGVLRNEIRDLLPPDSLWLSLLPWQLVFGPALAVLAALMLALFVTRFLRMPALLNAAVGGLGCWVTAVLLEGLAKPVFMARARGLYREEVALEEGFELLGATLLLVAFTRYAAALRAGTAVIVEVRGQGRRIVLAILALVALIAAGGAAVAAVSLRSSAWLYRHNARQLEKRDKCAEAIVAYREAVARDHADGSSLAGIARCHARLGHDDRAVADYDRAIAVWPRDATLWNGRGVALSRLRRPAEAEGSFRRAAELRPGYGRAWRNLGLILEKLERCDEAAVAFRRALAADPGDGRSRRYLERLSRAQP